MGLRWDIVTSHVSQFLEGHPYAINVFLRKYLGVDGTIAVVAIVFLFFVALAAREIFKNREKKTVVFSVITDAIEGNLIGLQKAVDEGRDLNYRNADGETALMYAVANKRNDIVRFLVENGANPSIQSVKGKTALDYAVSFDNQEAEEYLREIQRRPNLHLALIEFAANGDIEKVKELVASGTSVNFQNDSGQTALMLAAANKHNELVQYLVENGSDTSIFCARGHRALDYARKNNNKVAEEFLKLS